MLDLLKDVLIVITASGALLSCYIKSFNNLLSESIKGRYKNVPIKQSVFEVVIRWISIAGAILYILFMLVSIFLFFKYEKWNDMKPIFTDAITVAPIIVKVIVIILLVGFSVSIISTIFLYWDIKSCYIDKIECKEYQVISDKKILLNKIGIIASVIVTLYGIITAILIFTQRINVINKNGIYIFENNISNEEIKSLSTAFFYSFICLTCFILLSSYKNVIKAINDDIIYTITTDKGSITTRAFLEYEQYYLIINNNIQRYIEKSEVKEIIKEEISEKKLSKLVLFIRKIINKDEAS